MTTQDPTSTFLIDDFVVGGPDVFVIAEIGNNHQGDLDMAKQLVEASIEAGADCVKFQLRNRQALYRRRAEGKMTEDLGAEYIQDLLNKFELTLAEHRELRRYCDQRGILYICTPWDECSLDVLATMDVPALKLASADLCNPYLIAKAAKLGVPLILSTGMSFENEILLAIDQLNRLSVPFALLHCNSTYPAPETDIQLPYIRRLKELHGVIGYSGHERGIAISLAAVAMGATIVERHITLDRSLEGPDHLASLEPAEFQELVSGVRSVQRALLWEGPGRHVSQGELLNRENLAKSVVAARQISKGQIFTESSFLVASPGQGLPPYRLRELIGKTAMRVIEEGEFLYESDISGLGPAQYDYSFPIRWGIPVRYHDFADFAMMVKPDLYEFHLSYRDLAISPELFLQETACTRLVVHAPELFENSELLDLVSDDPAYRQRSIDNLQRVVDATHDIARFFPKADSHLIVANIGGFSADEPLPKDHRQLMYQRFHESCQLIKWGDTELIPQNMAPFPWHFGGQRYQNIFMMPQELSEQASKHGFRLCLDLAHLKMTCNHFKLDFATALETLLPLTAHLHVSDASGTNGEGVVMGTGDICWPPTWKSICKQPGASFIPEVWQGHKDHGAGFWQALNILSSITFDEQLIGE
ncbi:N-acetylneuraminate synthase family protein [Synechococcus sp. LTW-G]